MNSRFCLFVFSRAPLVSTNSANAHSRFSFFLAYFYFKEKGDDYVNKIYTTE